MHICSQNLVAATAATAATTGAQNAFPSRYTNVHQDFHFVSGKKNRVPNSETVQPCQKFVQEAQHSLYTKLIAACTLHLASNSVSKQYVYCYEGLYTS